MHVSRQKTGYRPYYFGRNNVFTFGNDDLSNRKELISMQLMKDHVISAKARLIAGSAGTAHKDELERLVRRRLHDSRYLELRLLDCDLTRGVLTLLGTVSCFHHKQLAFQEVADLVDESAVAVSNKISVQAIR